MGGLCEPIQKVAKSVGRDFGSSYMDACDKVCPVGAALKVVSCAAGGVQVVVRGGGVLGIHVGVHWWIQVAGVLQGSGVPGVVGVTGNIDTRC